MTRALSSLVVQLSAQCHGPDLKSKSCPGLTHHGRSSQLSGLRSISMKSYTLKVDSDARSDRICYEYLMNILPTTLRTRIHPPPTSNNRSIQSRLIPSSGIV